MLRIRSRTAWLLLLTASAWMPVVHAQSTIYKCGPGVYQTRPCDKAPERVIVYQPTHSPPPAAAKPDPLRAQMAASQAMRGGVPQIDYQAQQRELTRQRYADKQKEHEQLIQRIREARQKGLPDPVPPSPTPMFVAPAKKPQ